MKNAYTCTAQSQRHVPVGLEQGVLANLFVNW